MKLDGRLNLAFDVGVDRDPLGEPLSGRAAWGWAPAGWLAWKVQINRRFLRRFRRDP
jgi:hypothetical protein